MTDKTITMQQHLKSRLKRLESLMGNIPDSFKEEIEHSIIRKDFQKAENLLNMLTENSPLSKLREKNNYLPDIEENNEEDEYSKNRIHRQLSRMRNQNIELENRVKTLSQKLDEKNSVYQTELNELAKNYRNMFEEREKLKKELNNLATEKQQKRIEDKIPTYVDLVSEKLSADDCLFMEKSKNWSQVGLGVSGVAVILSIASFIFGYIELVKAENLTVTVILFIFFRGLLGIGILTWISYFCFNMSSSYIHESILRKDRQHALSFGKVFLQIYGDTATKQEAIQVFKDWNMSGETAFSKKNTPPPSISQFIDLKDKITNKENEDI